MVVFELMGKGLNATPKTEFGLYSGGREENLGGNLHQDATSDIGFRERTRVTV